MTYPPSPGEPLPPPVDPYDTPQHTAPLYHQPDYRQPDYGQPTYVAPAYPAAPPPPPPPPGTSRTTVIVLLSVAIGLVLLMGGGTAIYLVGKSLSTTTTKQGGTASPSPSLSPSTSPKDSISIEEPDTLNGHDKLDADEFDSLTEDLEKELEGYPGAANAFGAVYGSVAEKKLIAAFAAEVDIDDPQRMLDVVFQSFSGENQLTGVTSASTGALGGVAQCGTTRADKTDMALCGWADEGSVGMFLFFDETAVDVKGDFPDMRAEIETKD
ncbi:hypothetical protein [Actinoplanes sichuanensis]|uniref:Uncharacterized protein n=1 Tax=Actinoplanes sichuanensis TaxID=512349 RepID=A0ABW4APB1_9ACTN|nr:hypothetical protein [Actinoplanes sichuanensis]